MVALKKFVQATRFMRQIMEELIAAVPDPKDKERLRRIMRVKFKIYEDMEKGRISRESFDAMNQTMLDKVVQVMVKNGLKA